MTEPVRITAGDAWEWSRTIAAYPAPAWSATYHFRDRAGAGQFSIAATGDGSTFTATRTAAQSAAIAPGSYYWTLLVTDGTARHTVETGRLEVLPDPAGAGGYDPRTYYERLLDAVRAVLADTATHDQQSYSVAGRSLARIPRSELLAMETRLRWEVASERRRERSRKGLPSTTFERVKFVRP